MSDMNRIAKAPDGEQFSIEAHPRHPWPLALDLYELVLGWLHIRILGFQVVVKWMPVKVGSPALHRERVRTGDDAKRRVDELAGEIEAGQFGHG